MGVGDYLGMLKLNNRRNKILIDTNVIVYMFEQKKDVFDFAQKIITDAEFFILDKSIKELEKVYKEKPKKLEQINKFIDKLLIVNKMKILECSKEVLEKFDKVDKILIYLSKEYLIYTNDRKLKEKILAKNRRVLTLRLHDVYLN